MNEISFEQLPKAVSQIWEKLNEIERLLNNNQYNSQPEKDRWFDLSELCNYLPDKPSKATAYGWVHNCTIPCHKGQKKLRFLKSEIDQWLMEGKRNTFREIALESGKHLRK